MTRRIELTIFKMKKGTTLLVIPFALKIGELREWFKRPDCKSGRQLVPVSWVRILHSPLCKSI